MNSKEVSRSSRIKMEDVETFLTNSKNLLEKRIETLKKKKKRKENRSEKPKIIFIKKAIISAF